MERKKIYLWSSPRSLSSAFYRCITQIKNMKGFHEPRQMSYYLGPDRISEIFLDEPVVEDYTYENCTKLLTAEYEDFNYVFVKDMAYHMVNRMDEVFLKEFQDFQHTFLIRSPKKQIPSLFAIQTDENLIGMNSFNPVQAGSKELWEMFCLVKENLNQVPIVVDADDVEENPAGTIKAYCQATGLPYHSDMLSWKAEEFDISLQDFKKWKGWHTGVFKSTGLSKKDPDQLKDVPDLTKYPPEVKECVDQQLPYYEMLRSYKLTPIPESDL